MKQALQIFSIALLFIFFTAPNANAQSSRVKGRTVAATADGKKVLPNVPIKLSGSVLSDKTRETVSDDEGNYIFTDVIAGDYTLGVELQGFEKFERKIPVQFDATTEINIELKPRDVTESVDVKDTAVDEARNEASVPGVVTNETLTNAPLINERFQDALPLIPGVVRGQDGLLNVKGTRASQSGILVSSVNVTDPVTGTAAIELPVEAVETIQVFSNPYSSEYGRFTGAVTQIETRAGTNEFKFVGSNVLPRFRNRDGATVGIESFAPRIAFSGPVIKNKLFFFQSLEYRYIRTPVNSLPALRRDTKLESFDSFTRLDYTINETNRLTGSFSVFPQKLEFFNLNTFNPQETTANFHQRGFFVSLNEQAVIKQRYLLQSNLSVKQFDANIFPNQSDAYRITPERNFGAYFNRQDRDSRRYELSEILNLPSFDFLRGTHQVKLGLNLSRTNFNGTDTNQTVSIVRGDGTASELITFFGDGRLKRSNFETAVFVQDKWTPSPRVTFDVGVRFDRDSIGGDNNIAPRFGFAVLPTKDFKTVVRGGVGLFYDKIPLNIGAFEDFQNRRIFFVDDATRPLPVTLINQYANDDLTNPRSTAFNIQIDREINQKLLVRAGYEERRTTRDFLVTPQLGNSNDGLLLLSNTGRSRYREWQFLTKIRLQERRDVIVSYTRSRAEGDTNDFNTYFGNIRNPIIRPNEYTLQPFDVPHRFLAYGNIGLPFDITVLPVADYRTGFPFSTIDEFQNYVSPRNRGGRFPNFLSFDVQATIGVKVPFRGKTYRGRAGFKIFNITNHFNPRDVQANVDSQAFGSFYNSVGRQFRLKFEFLKF